MTPKEKANKLVNKYFLEIESADTYAFNLSSTNLEIAKKCALIAVDEIIESREDDGAFDDTLSSTSSEYYTPHPMYLSYWIKVRDEIKNL